jgi:hypothetical protein
VDADVVPIHGGVIVSEGAGDEDLRGEDEGAHTPASTNWTIESSEGWRGIDRQASAGHHWFVAATRLTVVADREVPDEGDRGDG